MNRLSRPQKEKIVQFRQLTESSEKVALQALTAAGWSVEGAIDVFFAHSNRQPRTNNGAIQTLFCKYKAPYDDAVLAEGVGQFCEDLGVDPADVVMLVISWHFKAATMCEFSREEFVTGMESLGCDSIAKLQAKLPALRAEMQDEQKFKEIYAYAYLFSREKGQKCVQLETATAMWRLVFADRDWPLIDEWCNFLTKHHNRAISRDAWVQLLDFSRTIDTNLDNYDENGAWPYLIDEFVEYLRERRKEAVAA